MKATKILPLVQQTALALSLPEDLVALVVSHQFSSIKEALLNPTKGEATILVEQLGKFRPSLNAVNKEILRLIPLLRTDPTPTLLENFRYYWLLRQDAIKEKDRRNFKKRYGSWHY